MERVSPLAEEVHDDSPRDGSVHLEHFRVGRARPRVREPRREREPIRRRLGARRVGRGRRRGRSGSREERRDDARYDVQDDLAGKGGGESGASLESIARFLSLSLFERAHLFVHGVAFSKHAPATDETCEERVEAALLAAGERLLHQEARLVQCDKLCEVERVLFRRAKDVREPLSEPVPGKLRATEGEKDPGEEAGRVFSMINSAGWGEG